MAVNKVVLSNNVHRALQYAGSNKNDPKVKSNDSNFLKLTDGHHQRVLLADGINCSSNPEIAFKQMKPVIDQHQKGKSQCVHSIVSFGDLNYTKRSDWYKAMGLDKEVMAKKFPHTQIACYLQADNHKHLLHVHNIICGYQAASGRSNITRDNWQDIARTLDSVEKEHHITPVHQGLTAKSTSIQPQFKDHSKTVHNSVSTSHAIQKNTKNKEYSWVDGMRKAISNSCLNTKPIKDSKGPFGMSTKSINQFRHNLKNNGIQVEMISMRKDKKTGRRIPHIYKSKPKSRGIVLNLPNKQRYYVRLRKHWSYSYKFTNPDTHKVHRYVIREKRLGSEFNNQNIIHNFGKPLLANKLVTNGYAQESSNTNKEISRNNKLNNKLIHSNMQHDFNHFNSNPTPTPTSASSSVATLNTSKSKSKVVSSAVAPAPKVHTVVNSLVASAKKFNNDIVDNSVSHNKFSFPDEDHLPQLVKVAAKHDHKSESNEATNFKKTDYKRYIHHQAHWLAQQKQLAGHHWITKYFYLNSPNIKVPEKVLPNRIKVPRFHHFRCLDGFTMPQVLYSNNNGNKEQDDIAQNAFKQEDEETQNAIRTGATEVEQADAEDVYEEERANAEDIRRLQHEQSDDGPTLSRN